ncbi:PREDICTED: protein takeout-like isoform X1 [Eufriesea mexicana]|uniref:protein takeout-like isoform X1 n=1 Tax=Eufriesea mexicana TaxID=516756 RepID=UPI00083C47F1|nr:PREDICTED: protein takeout-like isoform X1 [Eufriesea mexicana]
MAAKGDSTARSTVLQPSTSPWRVPQGWTNDRQVARAPYIKPCKKSDPDINKCITRSIDQLRDKLATGIPELEAPAIEPLNLKEIRLFRGPVGARLDINITDLRVSGPSTFKIRDLKADVENVVFTFKVNFEKLNFQGKYQINTRVLLLKLTGQGELTGTFTDYDSDVVLRARKVFRDGDTYLNFERMKVKIKIGKANLHLSNLFGGDTVLSAATHELLNNNNALFLDEITPVLELSLAELFTDVANKITKSFTYKELFPDD